MEQITQPLIPAPTESADLEYEVPREGVGRNVVIDAYLATRSLPPLMDRKRFSNEVRAWAGALGRQAWIGDKYAPVVRTLLAQPAVAEVDRGLLDGVEEACTTYAGPLSRYSLGWVISLDVWQPDDLPLHVSTLYRESARSAAVAVRRDMTDPPAEPLPARDSSLAVPPCVIGSEELVTEFLDDQTPRSDYDTQRAMNAYVTKLRRDHDAKRDLLERDESDEMSAVIERAIVDFGAVPDEQFPPEQLKRFELAAEIKVNEIFDDQLARYAETSPAENVDETRRRLVVECLRVLKKDARAGHDHTGESAAESPEEELARLGRVLDGVERGAWTKANQVRADLEDRDRRRRNSTAKVRHRRTRGVTYASELLARAAERIDADPDLRIDGRPSWEAATAKAMLQRRQVAARFDPDDLRELIGRKWNAKTPKNTGLSDEDEAVTEVLLVMLTQIGRAERDIRAERGPTEKAAES
ncbi:MAG: hypothetical protein QM809_04620 [Gordonia sp. (in: high G+C Gram-positive bacteria)]|uniref:hypothetical protein n=1 Tax=Gordonia sp. (in: high G+C Gram-positive bacteria) TaxID=84139 RepID=UPI0039E3CCE7